MMPRVGWQLPFLPQEAKGQPITSKPWDGKDRLGLCTGGGMRPIAPSGAARRLGQQGNGAKRPRAGNSERWGGWTRLAYVGVGGHATRSEEGERPLSAFVRAHSGLLHAGRTAASLMRSYCKAYFDPAAPCIRYCTFALLAVLPATSYQLLAIGVRLRVGSLVCMPLYAVLRTLPPTSRRVPIKYSSTYGSMCAAFGKGRSVASRVCDPKRTEADS
jgi:hypothetical protein